MRMKRFETPEKFWKRMKEEELKRLEDMEKFKKRQEELALMSDEERHEVRFYKHINYMIERTEDKIRRGCNYRPAMKGYKKDLERYQRRLAEGPPPYKAE